MRRIVALVAAICILSLLAPSLGVAQSSSPQADQPVSDAALDVVAVDASTGMPMDGCVVNVGDASAVTSADGVARLEIAAGDFEIIATGDGYQTLTVTLQTVAPGETLERELMMVPGMVPEPLLAGTDARVDEYLDELGDEWSVAAAQPEGDDLAEPLAAPPTQVPVSIRLIRNGVWNGSFSINGTPDVVTVGMDEYLKGVVPREVSNLWPTESIKAQAVAARSYATSHMNRHSSVGADICNTVHCQAWSPAHYSQTDAAVDQTSGIVARYGGEIIKAYFYGHCDGNTRNSEDVWGGYLGYCRATPCDCGYTSMYGHGVGMCQQGARADALAGKNYIQILQHYYKGVTVGTGMPRAWGSDRYATAVETAKFGFDPDGDRTWPGVKHVIIASGEDRAAADPLAASGLVWAYDAPIFLIQAGKVPWQVREAISDIAEHNGPVTVHIVGGTYSVPSARANEIRDAAAPVGVTFDRVRTGGDRFDMAAAIAARVTAEWKVRYGADSSPGVVLAANGADSTKFFDALALSPIAAKKGYPIVLVAENSVPGASQRAVNAIKPVSVIVGGGPATVSNGVAAKLSATRWWGGDRYSCALDIANNAVKAGWLDRKNVGVSAKLPDALVAGSVMGRKGGVSIITNGQSLTPSVRTWLSTYKAEVEECYIFGGPVSVTGATESRIAAALAGGGVTTTSSSIGRFPEDSVWYARVDGLPVHASSAVWVDTIGRDDYVHPDFGSGMWAGGPIGIPFCPS